MKNYTSTVDAETTIWRIEQLLIQFGARNISKDYHEGQVTGIFFTLSVPEIDTPLSIRLPASVDAVEKVFLAKRKGYVTTSQKQKLSVQAKRTAWKLIQDWVAVQLSLIEMRQAEAAQVFMPYMWNDRTKKTFFSIVKDSGYKGLTYQPEKPADEEK